MPKQKTFVVNSIFNSGLAEFDNNIAFIELNVLEEFFGYNPDERNFRPYFFEIFLAPVVLPLAADPSAAITNL